MIWEQACIPVDGYMYNHDIATWNGVSILVLDNEVIPRKGEKLSSHSYGLHNPSVISEVWGL